MPRQHFYVFAAKIMKLTTLLLTLGCLQLSAAGFSQKITLSERNVPLEKVFLEIRKQTGYLFLYNNETLEQAQKVSIEAKNTPLEEVLRACFKGQPVTYTILEKTIVVKPRTQTLSPQEVQQRGIISGKVTDNQNISLPGVSVRLEGAATQSKTTDADGNYSFTNLPQGSYTISFTYIGFTKLTKSLTLGENQVSVVNVSLQDEISNLNEVVVVGYGTQKRSDLTGAIASVSEKEIKQVPVLSTDQALQGRASGVQVIQSSGEPGAPISIRVRGGTSINAGNEPLFVVDGYPLDPGSSLTSINPSDIESLEILKDASATAIYGSRGANGVVLVTTKRGKLGKPVVTYESYAGQQQVRRTLPLLNAQQYAELLNEANVNSGADPAFTPQQIAAMGPGTNWQDELFRNALITNHQLGVNGGTETIRYAVSGNFFKQDGIIINSGFQRSSFRANLDIKLNDKFKVGNSLTIAHTNNSGVETANDGRGVINNALRFTPIATVYNADGTFNQVDIPQVDVRGNPVARSLATTDRARGTRVLGNAFVDYSILKNLVLKVSVGADLNLSKNNFYVPSTIFEGNSTQGFASVSNSVVNSWLNENTLSYNKVFNGIHSLNVVGGVTFQKFDFESAVASTQGFTTDALTYNNLGTGSSPQPPGSNSYQNTLMSYLGRVNYVLNDKYLFTLTGRADGSSRFGSGNKMAFFPSGSIGWRASEEDFIKNLNVFSNLKLRASVGLTGNQEIPNYQSLAQLGTSRYLFGGVPQVGFSVGRVPNPDLRWESTRQMDVGLEMGFFNNRLTSTIDFYSKRTYDLLLNVPLPFTSGFGGALQNIGATQNRGVEFALNSQNFTGAFSWSTSLNLSANRNKVLDLGGVDFFFAGESSGGEKYGNSGIIQVGQPIGSFVGITADGIFQSDAEVKAHTTTLPNGTVKIIQPSAKPGDRRFIDSNQDGAINAADRTIIGRAYPKFFGGLSNNFSYKGFDLNVFLQGVYGSSILNLVRPGLENVTGGNNQLTTVLDRWTPTNPSTTVPRAVTRTNTPNLISTAMLEDGSYLRAKNITLGYNLPASVLKSLKVANARVYLSGQNLFTITNYSGYDPEVNTFGASTLSLNTDFGAYPTAKTFMLGLNVGF